MKTNVKRPSLSEEAVSRLIDPRTGQRLRPLGVVGGRTVWPIMGSSPDDDSLDDKKDNPEDKGGPEGDTLVEDKAKGDPDAKIAALSEEKDRHVRRRQEAETERDQLKSKLDELESKDKSELEKTSARVTVLESENAALQESLKTARLENAFLASNDYEWHNPGRALSLADLKDVEIDDDGTVHGLKKALDALAKSDAYLLKDKEKENDEEEPPVSTGDALNPAKKGTKKKQEADEALRKKYSALRR